MQLSNQPAEALAKKLVDTSGGAFTLCGFASGGLILLTYFLKYRNTYNFIQDRKQWKAF